MVHLPFNLPHPGLLLMVALGLSACQQGQTQTLQPSPLAQEDRIQVYTNHEPASSYSEPYRHQTRAGDDLEQKIVETIVSAHSSIDVAVQELRLPKVAAALIQQQQAGVKVRVILENTYARPFSHFTPEEVAKLPEREQGRYEEFRQLVDLDANGELSQAEIEQGDALVMLDRAKIPRIDDTADGSAGSNLMHDKFIVVDDRVVIVTSANFTTSDTHGDFKTPSSRGNANNLLRIESPELATLFTQEFNQMWGDGPGGKPDSKFGIKKPFRPARQVTVGSTLVEVQFSPAAKAVPWHQTSNGLIGKTLSTATRSIEMALFVFSDQALVNLLEPLHNQGIEMKALIEPGFAYRSYSEGLDMLGIALADDCRSEPDNHPWQAPIATVGVPRLPPGDLLHHKFGIVDQTTVITGSHNWTQAANNGNDETVLVVHSPIVAAHFQREFDRLYEDAVLGIPPAIQKKVDAQVQQCKHLQAQVVQQIPTTALATTKLKSPPRKQGNHAERLIHPAPQSRLNQRFSPTTQSVPSGQRVNLNTASQAELEALPGVGPGLAKRILAARQQQRFHSLEDLDRVPGVGPKLLKKLAKQVSW